MHLRVSRVRRNGQVYEYAQLVESYRRASDSMPAHRVVANLGRLSPEQVANLRCALKAAREGKRVAVVKTRKAPKALKLTANLRYLDLAVLLELWRQLGLDELLARLLPQGEADVNAADVVCALALQRCVDPGSKLFAQRWFPRTALPELLGLSPNKFNNTRVHRVLERLDHAEPDLQPLLARKLAARRNGKFSALYLDITDTWFVGHGPESAEYAKTKEGMIARKIGIVLLCDSDGLPIRWQVVRGRQGEQQTMRELLAEVRDVSWLQRVPLVCDRAMGRSAQIEELLGFGLNFVTALVANEWGSYLPNLPFDSSSILAASDDDSRARAQAQTLAGQHQMKRVDDSLYVLDLGVLERPYNGRATDSAEKQPEPIARFAMRMATEVRRIMASEQVSSQRAAGNSLGLSRSATIKYVRLLHLNQDIQRDILQGKADMLSLGALLKLIKITDPSEQRAEFERLVGSRPSRAPVTVDHHSRVERSSPTRMRAVLCFNPTVFVQQRYHAQQQLEQIEQFVRDLNERVSKPRSRLTKRKIEVLLASKLERHSLSEVFDFAVHPTSRITTISVNQKPWQRRRRRDGFSVIVAHPDNQVPADSLPLTYRAKDQVEKDFQTIKSFIKLRPVHHQTEAKVRAHVTVCMLALLLERVLTQRLHDTCSAKAAIEQLSTANLNIIESDDHDLAYTITEPNPQQLNLLSKLQMLRLADDDEIADQITPR